MRELWRKLADVVKDEPRSAEVLWLFVVLCCLYLAGTSSASGVGFFDGLKTWLDNPEYLRLASIIRERHADGQIPHLFWGFPFVIAALSAICGVPGVAALLLITWASAIAACILISRLYGGWIALAFIAISTDWIVASVKGGSEPLFVLILCSAFLAARSNRAVLAALFGSLATVVRPVGVIALVAFGVVLLARRKWRDFVLTVVVSASVGVLYLLAVRAVTGDALISFCLYSHDWGGGWGVFTFPFLRIWKDSVRMYGSNSWSVWIRYVWAGVSLAASVIAMVVSQRWRKFATDYPTEATFGASYVIFFILYDFDGIMWELPRYVIPTLPLMLISFGSPIPKDRRAVWCFALMIALLSSFRVNRAS